MEYKYPYFLLIGLIGSIFWSIDFWKLFQKFPFYISLKSIPKSNLKNYFRFFVFLLGLAGWGFLAYSLTQPRKPQSFSPKNIKVNDIVLCIDVSRSMLAEDIRPNRLEVAKEKIREFVSLRPTDRIGIVLFSEKVFTLLPLTTDPLLVDKAVSEISIGFLGSGTNIGDGLALSVARAVNSDTKNKVVILLTDGVANVGTMTPLQGAEEAKKYGIKVYTIGLGTDESAKIPTGRGVFGNQYQLIPGGSIDYKVLDQISKMTGGKFYPAKSAESLKEILDDIQKLEKTDIEVNNQVIYEELFYSYLFIGILFLFISEILKKLVVKDLL
jgi:Ca-activated chloride channel family protein